MAGRGDDDQIVAEPGQDAQIRMRLRALDETDIGVVADDAGNHLRGIADQHAHPAVRMRQFPAGQQGRQQVFADRQAGGDAQRRGVFAAEQVLELSRLLQQRRGHRQQRAAVFVEHQASADPVEQPHGQHRLELGKGRTGRRLRARDAGCRGARRALVGDGHEDFKLAQVQTQSLTCFFDHRVLNSPLF